MTFGQATKSGYFDQLLPPGTVIVEADVGMWDTGLLPIELPHVRYCVDKRRREFAAGRNCARSALRALGFEALPILVGMGRMPLFPAGISGSITHTDNYCAAAAVRTDGALTIGIDAERDEPLEVDIWPLLMGDVEQVQMARLRDVEVRNWERLLFSAKEAFYKASFPLHRQFVDFRDVIVEVCPNDRSFLLHFVKPGLAAWSGKREFSGRYRFVDGLIVTALTVRS